MQGTAETEERCEWTFACDLCEEREERNCSCPGGSVRTRECWYIAKTSHLMNFHPESSNPGKSFLVLGKLCEYLKQYIVVIKVKDDHYYKTDWNFRHMHGLYDWTIIEGFRQNLDIIQTKCIKVARESLESLLEQKLPRLAASNVFDHLIADWGKVEEDCRFEEYQDEDFGVLHTTYWSLVQIFTALCGADGGFYCDKHNINNINSNKPKEVNVK